ncbi:MAG: dolichol-phosphate mannosyltransferase [Bradymonadia bacterium]|jgi:dolichol-phosphate mannosyltransferase
MPKPLIVIPTYNELDNLPTLLDQVHEALPEAHVLIVDDGSPDGTGALADTRAAADDRVHVMHRAGKQGLGTAYIAGFRWALERDYTHVFEMDADFSHEPRMLPILLAATDAADFALGSRWVKGGGTVNWPLKRRMLSRGGSLYARTVLGLSVRDLTGGFKCFTRKVLEGIDLDGIHAKGYGFQVELTYRAVRAGFKPVEVPIRFADRVAGESKMSGSIFAEALTLVWKLRLGLV